MKKIRIGVVGIGHLGNYHVQKYLKLAGVELAGVSDSIPERCEKAAREYGCPGFHDFRELIGKVDAVSIAVPTAFHHDVARPFLSAGKDVLLEKPITATLKEADELIRLSKKNRAILQIGFIERFNPAIVALENVMGTPLFIESHRLHPFFTRGTDVDVVLDLMIHDLDIIVKFVKSEPKQVEAVGISVLSDKVDIANARLTFENGCVANITASRITGKFLQKIRFFGLEGYHSVDYAKRELISIRRKRSENGQVEIDPNPVEVGKEDPLEEEIRAFVGSVRTRSVPQVSGEEARKSLRLAIQIMQKMKSSQKGLLNDPHGGFASSVSGSEN